MWSCPFSGLVMSTTSRLGIPGVPCRRLLWSAPAAILPTYAKTVYCARVFVSKARNKLRLNTKKSL